MSRAFAILFLLAFSLGIYLGTTSAPALVDEADCAHAIAARELRESGDWAVLHINGIRYLEKAPLHYWLVAASYKILGESDFSTRLPLALATVALLLMVYVLGRRFFGERAGFYAGLVMCTSLGTFVFTRTMIPEAIYALEFTAAFYLFLRAWQGTLAARIGYWGAAALVALATLTRGLVGVIFPVAVIGLFLLAIGGWRRWRELPLPSTWRAAPNGAAGLAEVPAREARLLLFAWAGFILFFFSLTRRMEYYSFGAWPAIALLLGVGLARAEAERHRWLPRLQGALTVTGLLAVVALGALLWVSRHVRAADIASLLEIRPADFYQVALANLFDLTPQAFAALRAPAIATALSLLAGLGAAWLLRRRGRALSAALAMALGAAGFIFAANGAYRIFEPHLSSRALAEEISKHLRAEDRILLYGDFYNACTVSFYTHRKTWIWNGRYHSLEYGSDFPDAPRIFLTDQDFAAFWEGPQRVFLVVPELHRRQALLRLPADSTYVLAESGGKAAYVNQPIGPGQPTLAALRGHAATRTD